MYHSINLPHKHENMIIWCKQLGHSFHLFHSVSYWQTVLAVDETFCGKKVFFSKKKTGMGLATEDCRDVWGVRQLVNHVTKSSLKLHLCHDVNFSNCLACQKWPVSQTHWITKVTRLSSLFWLSWSLFCHCLSVGHINSRYPSDQSSERSKASWETLKFLTAIWD